MGAVVARDTGIRTARRVSHCFVMDVPGYKDPLIVTDAAVNIAPDLAGQGRHRAERDRSPRALRLRRSGSRSSRRWRHQSEGALDGRGGGPVQDGRSRPDHWRRPRWPVGARQRDQRGSAEIEHIVSPVAGRANVLVVPDLEAGNMLAKTLTFLAGADAAGIVLGARVPIILTSRADSVVTRLASCAVASLLADARRRSAKEAIR